MLLFLTRSSGAQALDQALRTVQRLEDESARLRRQVQDQEEELNLIGERTGLQRDAEVTLRGEGGPAGLWAVRPAFVTV